MQTFHINQHSSFERDPAPGLLCWGLLLSLLALTDVIDHADNVGDNVGDIAGMGSDLFGSFAESTCAALVISSVSTLGSEHIYTAMSYPLLISATGIVCCLLTTFLATDIKPARLVSEIENSLKLQLVVSTVLATPVSFQAPQP